MLKLLNLNSIRSRMVSGFLFLVVLILILAFVSLYMLDRTGRIAGIHGTISQLEVFTLSLIKADNDFLSQETSHESYFKTRQSALLKERDSLLIRIENGVAEVKKKSKNKSYSVDGDLKRIDSTLLQYNIIFSNLEKLYYKKGFKDFGLEGEMRVHAHKMEEARSGVEVSRVLYLRRNEKDFFIRHDLQYVTVFNKLAAALLSELKQHETQNKEIIFHLTEYKRLFNEVVEIQQSIGLDGSSGLHAELNVLTAALSNQYFALAEYSSTLSTTEQHRARIFYIIMLGGAFIFSALSAYWISKSLSEPIARLSRLMNLVTEKKSNRRVDFSLHNAAHEINTLASSFMQLMDQTNVQMKEIKTKSKLLKKRNGELKKLNAELDSFLYSTAHDLRSPLSSLLGLIDIARHENQQERLVPHFEMMENSIHRMEIFIGQIVNYSQNKKMKVAPEEINLRSMVSDIIENHRFVEGAQRIETSIDVQQQKPFIADRNRITILFNNLISNAIRYYDPTKSHSYIRIAILIDGQGVNINFSDNGLGIGREHLDKIFNMFYRANVNSKGSGLGLFIFKEIIDRMKGTVTVDTELGSGTRFIVFLPHVESEAHPQPQETRITQRA